MPNVYKGNDRALLKKAKQVLTAIKARDKKAQATKKTSAISSRLLILDADPPGTGANSAAATLLINRCTTLLALTA